MRLFNLGRWEDGIGENERIGKKAVVAYFQAVSRKYQIAFPHYTIPPIRMSFF
jgi:hypothetical protein